MGITLFRSKSQPSGALELTGLGHPQGQLYGEAERSAKEPPGALVVDNNYHLEAQGT